MSTAAARMTADEFFAMPVTNRNESLIDGEYFVDSPTWPHQMMLKRLLVALANWEEASAGRGRASLPGDVRIDDRNVFEPDLMWWAPGRDPGVTGERFGMPDIDVQAELLEADDLTSPQLPGFALPLSKLFAT